MWCMQGSGSNIDMSVRRNVYTDMCCQVIGDSGWLKWRRFLQSLRTWHRDVEQHCLVYLNLAKAELSSLMAALVTAWPTAWLTCWRMWGGIWFITPATEPAGSPPPGLLYISSRIFPFQKWLKQTQSKNMMGIDKESFVHPWICFLVEGYSNSQIWTLNTRKKETESPKWQ